MVASAEGTAAAEVPFSSGEVLGYEVSLLGIRAGEAELKVEGKGGSWRFVASGRTVGPSDSVFGLRQTASCTVEGEEFVPRLCLNTTSTRGSVRRKEIRFDPANGVVKERTLEEGKRRERELKFAEGMADVQDALSGVYKLRKDLPSHEGEVLKFRSYRKGKPITVVARYTGKEEVKTPAGTFQATVVEVRISEKEDDGSSTNGTVWFSDDPRRLPVKVQIHSPVGRLLAQMTSARGTVDRPVAGR